MFGVQSIEEDAMEPYSLMWVGSPCGSHGPYVFYKAFRFHLDAGQRLLSLGDFFPVRCAPGEPVCIAELQLLWEERTSKRLLSSSKLYFLPEDTPSGRTVRHGEDEVIAVSEKVVVQLEELVQWTVWDPTAWGTDTKVAPPPPTGVHRQGGRSTHTDPCCPHRDAPFSRGLKSRDLRKEKPERGGACGRVLVRSYLQYCRYRAVLSRLRGARPSSLLQEQLLLALGGIGSSSPEESAPRVLYCRDTFQHPALPGGQGAGRDLAPNLKGRPRKKKPSLCLRPDAQGQSQLKVDKVDPPKHKCSSSGHSNRSSHVISGGKRALLSCSEERKERRGGGRGGGRGDGGGGTEEQAFLVSLYKYMKERKTPIQRIPYLGFKQINLWTMFQAAQKLGGYELITARRQWKHVYDELGGNPGSTSAATCTRRHYERLILPYERFSTGDQDAPPPPLKARRRDAGHATAQASSRAPEVQPTNGVHPHEGKVTAPQEQTSAAEESSEKVLPLKLEPQTTTSKPSHPRGQRRHNVREDEGSEIQLTLKEQTREKTEMNRRSKFNLHDGDHSSLETDGKIESDILLQSPTTKALGYCHVALGLWKAEDLDQCHVGMVSPTLEHRESPLQSPLAVEDHSSERAHLPQRDQAVVGFTPLLSSPELGPGIMSPLAKKKLTSQVSRAESPSHKCFLHSVGAPSPLIHRGLTNGVLVEAAGQPIRPSVIKHVHSFRTQDEGVEKMKEGVESKGTQEVEDIRAPDQRTSLLSHRSIPHVHACTDLEDNVQQHLSSPAPSAPLIHRRARTPPGFFNDHYISSNINNPHRRNKSYPEPGPGQEHRTGLSVGQGQGVTENAALIPSGTHRAESCLVFPRKSVKTESQAFSLKQQLHWRNFTNELSHGVSTQRQWHQVSSLPKDTENCAHSSLTPLSCPDSSHISHMKDTMSADGDNSRTSGATDEQPTDLSLPKASSLKRFTQSSFLEPLSCPSPRQDGAQLSDTASRSLPQNGQRIAGVAYHPRACRVPPMSVGDMNTHAAMNSSRRCMAGDSCCRAADAIVHGQIDTGPSGGLEKGESGEAGGQYGRRHEAMNVTGEQACALRPILQSLATQQKVCTTRPLKRPMERMAENSSSERKIRAVSPMHTTTSFASSTSAFSSLTPPPKYTLASLCEQQKSQMLGEKCNGSHAVAVLKPLEASPQVPRDFLEGDAEEQPTGSPVASARLPLVSTPAAPHAFPAALYRPAGGFSLTQLSDLCGDHLGSPFLAGCPSSAPPSLPNHTLEYLKSRSAAVLSPLVPPFAIHSFMMQRQQLAHAAASPVPMTYRHPLAAASYGDLHRHRLFPVSLSSQPAFSPPQLNSVHSSTKLS